MFKECIQFFFCPLEQEIPYLFLDVMESYEDKGLFSCMKYLMETSTIYQQDAAIARRAFRILIDKLIQISGSITNQMEFISLLKQFQTQFQYHDM